MAEKPATKFTEKDVLLLFRQYRDKQHLTRPQVAKFAGWSIGKFAGFCRKKKLLWPRLQSSKLATCIAPVVWDERRQEFRLCEKPGKNGICAEHKKIREKELERKE